MDRLRRLLQTARALLYAARFLRQHRGPPLVEAAQRRDHDQLRNLLRAGHDPNEAYRLPAGGTGPGALNVLADDSDGAETVRLLLEGGADPDRGPRGFTPLMRVCSQGFLDQVELLLAHGANPNARSDDGHTVLACCVSTHARGEAAVRLIQRLVQAGADPNLPGLHGVTPLMDAVWWSKPQLVSALIEAGANVNAQCEGHDALGLFPGDTALSLAKRRRFGKITALIQAAGGIDPHPERTEATALPPARPRRAPPPGIDGGLAPSTLEDLRRHLRDPANKSDVAMFERRYSVTLPDHVRALLGLTNGFEALRGFDAPLTFAPVQEWRLGSEAERFAWTADVIGSMAPHERKIEYFRDMESLAASFLIAWTEAGEGDLQELVLRPPAITGTRDWDVIHVHMALDGHMQRYPDIQSALVDVVARMREFGFIEDEPEDDG